MCSVKKSGGGGGRSQSGLHWGLCLPGVHNTPGFTSAGAALGVLITPGVPLAVPQVACYTTSETLHKNLQRLLQVRGCGTTRGSGPC